MLKAKIVLEMMKLNLEFSLNGVHPGFLMVLVTYV